MINTIAVAVIDDIDEKGNYVYKTQEIPLRTFILHRAKTIYRKETASLNFYDSNQIYFKQNKFDEELVKFINSIKTDEELLQIFDFIGISSSNYFRAGMEESLFKKLKSKGKIRILRRGNYSIRKGATLSLSQYLEYRKNNISYFDTLKTRMEWLSENREVNIENWLKQDFSIYKKPLKTINLPYDNDKFHFSYEETHEATEEELSFYNMAIVKNEMKKQAKKLQLRKLKEKENELKDKVLTISGWFEVGRTVKLEDNIFSPELLFSKKGFTFSQTKRLSNSLKNYYELYINIYKIDKIMPKLYPVQIDDK